MGALKHFWEADKVDLWPKCLIYMAISITLLLWGCKSWVLTKRLNKSRSVSSKVRKKNSKNK